jgi:multiple sugar transport system substrate-binding protein
VDKNGKHPDDPGFDPENIVQYGCTVSTYWTYFYPFVLSNGGSVASEDGKTPMVDKPEFYEAVQRVADLMNKYHVAPNPAQRKSMPGTVTALDRSGSYGCSWSMVNP